MAKPLPGRDMSVVTISVSVSGVVPVSGSAAEQVRLETRLATTEDSWSFSGSRFWLNIRVKQKSKVNSKYISKSHKSTIWKSHKLVVVVVAAAAQVNGEGGYH